MLKRNVIPEGLRILADGSWQAGEQALSHPRRLRRLKQRLSFEDGGTFLVDGDQRVPIVVDGPPLVVDTIAFDTAHGETRVQLDDGTEEVLADAVIRMSPETGKLECAVKSGRARAVLSRVAHDAVLDALEQEGGDFFVPLGGQRVRVLP